MQVKYVVEVWNGENDALILEINLTDMIYRNVS